MTLGRSAGASRSDPRFGAGSAERRRGWREALGRRAASTPGAVLLFLLATGPPADVWAHASLVRSLPADGATLTDAPREVRLWFDEDISPRFSSAQLLDSRSQPVELAGVRTDPADPRQLIVSLRDLPPGIYSVLAKVLSQADGHVTRGFMVFGVGQEAGQAAAGGGTTASVTPPLEVGLRWVNFTLLAALIGALAVVQLVLRPAGAARAAGPWVAATLGLAEHRVLAWAAWCAGVAVLVGVAQLLWQAMTLVETSAGASLPSVAWQVLSGTRWGALWWARQGLWLALVGAVWFARRAPIGPAERAPLPRWPAGLRGRPGGGVRGSRVAPGVVAVAVLLALGLATVQALGSHAAAVSPHTTLAVVTDTLHLLAAGLWIGGLLALVVALWPLMPGDRTALTALAHAGWRRFSGIAAVSVGLLVATGLYSMSRQVASLDALIGTLYGRALLVKIGLVLAVGACGLLNAMLLHPTVAAPLAWLLRRPRGWTPCSLARLPTLVLTEAGLALLVLLATSVVTAAPAPRGPEFTVVPGAVPTVLSRSVDDVMVTLSVKPNRPGQNVFTVFAASTRRPPPADIMRVILRFTSPNADVGRVSALASAIERDRFQAAGSHLSLAGPWRMDVVVRRRGVEDTIAPFDWTVAPPGAVRPVVISKAPLASMFTVAAVGTLVTVLGLAALAWLARMMHETAGAGWAGGAGARSRRGASRV